MLFVNFFCVYVLNGDTIECDKPKINCKKMKISQMSIMIEVSLFHKEA